MVTVPPPPQRSPASVIRHIRLPGLELLKLVVQSSQIRSKLVDFGLKFLVLGLKLLVLSPEMEHLVLSDRHGQQLEHRVGPPGHELALLFFVDIAKEVVREVGGTWVTCTSREPRLSGFPSALVNTQCPAGHDDTGIDWRREEGGGRRETHPSDRPRSQTCPSRGACQASLGHR
jgi:hypothetical protein